MKAFLFFIILSIVIFSSSLFGQSCCGWIPLTWDTAPAELKAVFPEYFFNDGSVETSTDHSLLFGSTASLQFNVFDYPGTEYTTFFMKEFDINTGYDSFWVWIDAVAKHPSVRIRLGMITQGQISWADGSFNIDTLWDDYNPWIPFRSNIVDTLIITVCNGNYNGGCWVRLDNYTYWFSGVPGRNMIDSMGEQSTAVTEHPVTHVVSETQIYPNIVRQGDIVHITSHLFGTIYDINGRLIESFNQNFSWNTSNISVGQYFVTINSDNGILRKKITILN